MSTSTSKRILLVDDDQGLLDAMRRKHRKAYELHTACGGPEGLEAMQTAGPFAVVVSDYQMPGMDGITFLTKVRDTWADTVRIMLTGNADMQSAVDAVNKGQIFRFLSKPCAPEIFAACLDAALEQYRLRKAEQILLEQTVRGSIGVLADVLALANPDAFGRSLRVRHYVRQLAKMLKLKAAWQYETAALLSQIGLVAVPADVIERMVSGDALSEDYERVIARHPGTARDLLGKIPRLERIADMVANQRMLFRDAQASKLDKAAIAGAQILAATLDFDELVSLGASRADALRVMTKKAGAYDPRLLELLEQIEIPGQRAVTKSLPIKALRIGMIFDEDIVSDTGAKIMGKGNEITQSILSRIRNYAELGGMPEEVRVRVNVAKDAPAQDAA